MTIQPAWRSLLVTAALLAAAGCATPFDVGDANRSVTPREAARGPTTVQNPVAWGGMIANARNLTDETQFEVVGYPLDGSNRPQTDSAPAGRFIVIHPGYVETADYAPGRQVTVLGDVTGVREGKVGESPYVYPVVAASRLHLWPRESQQRQTEPTIHFGIGIGIFR